ncbi:MAG TPA: sigma-70 family RNA polymerase sigma factor [Thermoanaerobaculia bacterium]|nr:sigma-70 family RNA polymerase sigma factor [Thermoanaerobaculia bacterium]
MFILESWNGLLRLVVWMAPPRDPRELPGPSGGGGNGSAGGEKGPDLRDPEERFRELFEKYFEPVLRLFVRRGVPRETARDLTQETFLRVYRSFGRFRGEASLRTWVFHIAGNVWRNEVRRLRAEKREGWEVSLQGLTESGPAIAADHAFEGWGRAPGALDQILADEKQKQLYTALEKLPARMRRCVLLRIHGNLKYREIAVLMGTSIETVKSQLSQAQDRLERELGPYFDSFDLRGDRD